MEANEPLGTQPISDEQSIDEEKIKSRMKLIFGNSTALKKLKEQYKEEYSKIADKIRQKKELEKNKEELMSAKAKLLFPAKAKVEEVEEDENTNNNNAQEENENSNNTDESNNNNDEKQQQKQQQIDKLTEQINEIDKQIESLIPELDKDLNSFAKLHGVDPENIPDEINIKTEGHVAIVTQNLDEKDPKNSDLMQKYDKLLKLANRILLKKKVSAFINFLKEKNLNPYPVKDDNNGNVSVTFDADLDAAIYFADEFLYFEEQRNGENKPTPPLDKGKNKPEK